MKKETKPKGWANLQQQLKEVREESFKQGVWKGQLDKEKEMLDNKINWLEIHLERLEIIQRIWFEKNKTFLSTLDNSIAETEKRIRDFKERLLKLKGDKK